MCKNVHDFKQLKVRKILSLENKKLKELNPQSVLKITKDSLTVFEGKRDICNDKDVRKELPMILLNIFGGDFCSKETGFKCTNGTKAMTLKSESVKYIKIFGYGELAIRLLISHDDVSDFFILILNQNFI